MSLPCKVKHNELTSKDSGLHCTNCDKVLTDFRGKTNEEVVSNIQTAQQSGQQICGVFQRGQYDFKTSRLTFSAAQRKVGLSLLGILGFLGPVITSCSDADHTDTAIETKQKAFNNLKFPMTLEGMLKDETTGEPLAFAAVSVFQNGKVIRRDRTDANGNFSIFLQKGDLLRENFDFILSKEDYKTDTLKAFSILNASCKQKIQLILKAAPEECLPTLGIPHPSTGTVLPRTWKVYVLAGVTEIPK